jgi:hypothetical protein
MLAPAWENLRFEGVEIKEEIEKYIHLDEILTEDHFAKLIKWQFIETEAN